MGLNELNAKKAKIFDILLMQEGLGKEAGKLEQEKVKLLKEIEEAEVK